MKTLFLLLLLVLTSYAQQVISSASHNGTYVRIVERELMGRLYMLYFNVFQISHDSINWQDDTVISVTNEDPYRCAAIYDNLAWVRDKFMCTNNHSDEIWYSTEAGTDWKRANLPSPEFSCYVRNYNSPDVRFLGDCQLYEFKSIDSGRYDVRGFIGWRDSTTACGKTTDLYYYSITGGKSWVQCAGENWNTRTEVHPNRVTSVARKQIQYSYDILGRRINIANISGVRFIRGKKILIVR
jgi:hypothetical protein